MCKIHPLTKEQRAHRIIANVKNNKPSVMAEKFRHAGLAKRAEARGEVYVYAPIPTFLILGEPYTLQTIQDIVNEEMAEKAKRSAVQSGSDAENASIETPILTLETAYLAAYDDAKDELVEGEVEVTGVRLPLGSTRDWWDELTKHLQPENWTETMEFYVEYLTTPVVCDGERMDALRGRRHFP